MGGFIIKICDFTDVGNDDDELIKVDDSFHHVKVVDKGVERTLIFSSPHHTNLSKLFAKLAISLLVWKLGANVAGTFSSLCSDLELVMT